LKDSLAARHLYYFSDSMPAAELAGRKAECFFLAWVLGEVHRCCLRSEFVRRVAAERYGLAQVVYGRSSMVE
jgi:hypothetical protein